MDNTNNTNNPKKHPLMVELRALREARGWTIADLAAHGTRRSAVYASWERGDRKCNAVDLVEWAAIFGRKVILAESKDVPVTRTSAEIVSDLRRLANDLETTLPGTAVDDPDTGTAKQTV